MPKKAAAKKVDTKDTSDRDPNKMNTHLQVTQNAILIQQHISKKGILLCCHRLKQRKTKTFLDI